MFCWMTVAVSLQTCGVGERGRGKSGLLASFSSPMNVRFIRLVRCVAFIPWTRDTSNETGSNDSRLLIGESLYTKQHVGIYLSFQFSLYSFDTVGRAAGRATGQEKTWVMRCWRDYLFGLRCKWLAYGSADATVTPSSLLQKIQNGLSFWHQPTRVVVEKGR